MRNNLFQNIVTDENSYTELLCNLLSYKFFREQFFKFLGIKNESEFDYNTQYRTINKQKNGRPDLILSSETEYYFIKINNTSLTNNQPKGYLRELEKISCKNKYLFFIVPKNYKHKDELANKLESYNVNKKIVTNIYYWDHFFKDCKKYYSTEKNDIFFQYFQLLKEWFGYNHISFQKKGEIDMNIKEVGQKLVECHQTVDTIGNLLETNNFKIKYPETGGGEYGFYIYHKKVNLGWFGIWNDLWASKGDVFIFLSGDINNEKIFTKKYNDDGKDWPYLNMDKKIFSQMFDENEFVEYFIKEILNKLNNKASPNIV
jgi:hypothetical protein